MPVLDLPEAPPEAPPNARFLRGFFSLFFVAGLFVLGTGTLHPLWMSAAARSWESAPCKVITSHVRHFEGKGSGTFRIEITYRYDFRGQAYTSSRYSFVRSSTSAHAWKERVVAAHPPGRERTCYVNPADPREAVLEREPTWELYWGLVGLPFLLVGCCAFLPEALLHKFNRARPRPGRSFA